MKQYLNIAIVGTGFIGRQHIEAIRRIPYTRIVAAADSNEAMLKLVCGELGIERYYTDYREMLDREDIQVVHNCTPSNMHFEISREIMKRGIHVYCEKPLTLTSAEADELVELAGQMNVAAAANFNYRNNAMVRQMRQMIMDGQIGTPLVCHGEYLQDWLMYDTDYDWRMDPRLGGPSRALSDIGSHCFDTIQFVLGKKIVAVNASLITVYPKRKRTEQSGTFSASGGKVLGEYQVDSEDAAFVMARFEDGTQGVFNISQVCAGKKNGLMVNVSGSRASLEWHQEQSDRLHIGNRDRGNEELYVGAQYLADEVKASATLPNGHPVGWADAFRNGIASFYDSIRDNSWNRENTLWHATFRDACYIMKIVEACLKSGREKQWVEVE
ncbi:MAG: Gfo/Idh/MocA family oxidoreductase [Enterocloster asparagiformis]|nr:Gfo/Idh/MocA family oxidoreductase [Enterocloster asparagiformis]